MSDDNENGGGGAAAEDLMRYDLLAQAALKQVVRMALQRVERDGGLPGEHHFFISFETRHPKVEISPRLLKKYPEEMTIVLQHQFWDLEVRQDWFTVTLAFGGVPEKLVIPFDAVKGFFDPSVHFGLQFDVEWDDEEQAGKDEPARTDEPVAGSKAETGAEDREDEQAASHEAGEKDGEDGPKVVSLDAFRKK